MHFGEIPVSDATGAILAHSLKQAGLSFKKGRVLSAADVAALQQAGIATVIAARLEADDIAEDAAAAALAQAVAGAGVTVGSAFTGRCNLFAAERGLLVIDTARLQQVNGIDESLTVATLPAFSVVEKKQMLATVKIIPFAVRAAHLTQCVQSAEQPLIRIAPFRQLRVGLLQTVLPGSKDSVLDKTVKVLNARLERLEAQLIGERRCEHRETAVAAAMTELLGQGAELLLIAGASAIVDRRDVVPAGIVQAGGELVHFGMPVDPGNLLLLARHGAVPVLGLPGCARSPAFNGFDQVLERLAAGVPVERNDIMALGVGGLLKDIADRPAARTEQTTPTRAPQVYGLLLAAGMSRRMGEINKLLLDLNGQPMVARVADELLHSQLDGVIVVTGHEHEQVEAALAGRALRCVHNPAYREGLSTSLKAGLAALPAGADAVLVGLGDMPQVQSAHINKLLAAFDPLEGRAICVPTWRGKPGNPVLWARRFFMEMAEVKGDVGAKHLIGDHAEAVCEVEMTDAGVLLDIDTPAALSALALPNARP